MCNFGTKEQQYCDVQGKKSQKTFNPQQTSSSAQVFQVSFCSGPDSCHREAGRSSWKLSKSPYKSSVFWYLYIYVYMYIFDMAFFGGHLRRTRNKACILVPSSNYSIAILGKRYIHEENASELINVMFTCGVHVAYIRELVNVGGLSVVLA